MGKVLSIFSIEGSGFFKISNKKKFSRLLFDLLFTCRLKDAASIFIFHLYF